MNMKPPSLDTRTPKRIISDMVIPRKEKKAAVAALLRGPSVVLNHELVGLEMRLLDVTNPHYIGTVSKVTDESRNTLTVESEGQLKTLIKDQSIFSFRMPTGEWIRIDGKLLIGRPEDRIKKRAKKW